MNPSNTLHASELRRQILDHSAAWAARALPFRVEDREIIDAADLADLEIACPVEFRRCTFPGPLLIKATGVRGLAFADCTLAQLDLSGSRIHGDVSLKQCSIGALRMAYAVIDGCLALEGGAIGDGTKAIDARKLTVKGEVRLTGQATVHGCIDLRESRIEGGLRVLDTSVQAPHRVALALGEAVILGSADFSHGLECAGTINLVGLSVSGACDFEGAILTHPPLADSNESPPLVSGCSVYADRLAVSGDLFFSNGFSASGEVRLLGASIGGDLTCWGGRFCAALAGGDALSADNCVVKANVFFTEGMFAKGRVHLLNSQIGGVVHIQQATFSAAGARYALSLQQTVVGGDLRISDSKVSGLLTLARCRAGALDLRRPAADGSCALDLGQMECGLLKDEVESWKGYARYDLSGFKYATLFLNKAWNKDECIEWLAHSENGDFSPQPYEQLAAVQRSLGYTSDAREVLIARERRRPEEWPPLDILHGNVSHLWRRLFHWLYGVLVHFGYRPARAFTWAVALWIVGSLAIFGAKEAGGFVPAKSMPPSVAPVSYPRLAPPIYALESMVPFVKLRQEEFWIPDHSKPSGKTIQLYLWLQTLAGWILGTFLVASVSGLIRKD